MGFMYLKSKWRFFSRLTYHFRQTIKVLPGFFNRIVKRGIFSYDLCSTYWKRESYVYADGDFVRNSTLEMVAREISEHGVDGAVAELGVFRGEYAKLINQAFPTKKLYLFDTFDGFDSQEEINDIEKGFASTIDDFSDTSIELVLKKMKFQQNCVVKKGFFPNTTIGVDEKFAFVSIDCDLYQPIYTGLEFFYQHLTEGGYIFVHDYQNSVYSGAKIAVREFCHKHGIAYIPISDICGSAVITKPLSKKEGEVT